MCRSVAGGLVLLSLVVVALAGCTTTATAPSGGPATTTAPTQTPQAAPTEATATVAAGPTLCPQATPEWLRVEPVTSPTDQLSQMVTVTMGNLEVVTITAESGVFTGTGTPARVDVALLPDTVHHLEVEARVQKVWQQGCPYGGYTLRTTRDRTGGPLTIQQGEPGPPPTPGDPIGPDDADRLAPLLSLAPDARLTTDFAFRSNDELISVGYAEAISRWDLSSGKEIGRLGEGQEEATALRVAVSPDGSLIATGGPAQDPSVRLWDVETGEMRLLGRHESHPTALAFSPSGARLASGDSANMVWVWDLAGRHALASFEGDVPGRLQAYSGFHWLDDETLVAGASDVITWWDVTGNRLIERVPRPDEAAFLVEVAFGQAGRRLAAVAQDQAVYLWERETPGWTAWTAGPDASLNHVAFSPDGRLVAATTFDGELVLWDAETGTQLASYPASSGDIAALRFSPDGRRLAVGGWDTVIGLWGVR
jgi:WD40 repeat protein